MYLSPICRVMLTGQKTDGQGETMKPTNEDLKREIKEMEDDLIRQTKMNGIALTGCHVKTVEKSNDTHALSQCNDLLLISNVCH